MSVLAAQRVNVWVHDRRTLADGLARWEAYVGRDGRAPLTRRPGWLTVLERGLGHAPYCLEATDGDTVCGLLPLAHIHSLLFGGFLVGLPYLNTGGVLAESDEVARLLIDRAVLLADELHVRYLELRHERAVEHPALTVQATAKVHMRLPLPPAAGRLWDRLDGKVRNQVRKGRKNGLTVAWGGPELLPEFYDVFSRNMRDLGTPVYGRGLFRAVLEQFPQEAEVCVVRAGGRAAAAALLLHGRGSTEVPSASSLRQFNAANANMLMYWHLLERAVERGQAVFDFGRSSTDGSTYRFKEQWGARPEPAVWQYYLREGGAGDMRPDNPRYQRFIRWWRRLPVRLTRLIGPMIVRGIP
jgi:FemAB-related protein (PEP-CTERM system-associated)